MLRNPEHFFFQDPGSAAYFFYVRTKPGIFLGPSQPSSVLTTLKGAQAHARRADIKLQLYRDPFFAAAGALEELAPTPPEHTLAKASYSQSPKRRDVSHYRRTYTR